MQVFATFRRSVTVAALAALVGSAPALAATFVYVSNADDGDIGSYRLLDSGSAKQCSA